MKKWKSVIVALVTIVLVMSIFLARPPQTNAKFVLSAQSWSYPDEYGQGIEYVYFIVSKPAGTPVNWSYQYYNNTESTSLEVPNNASVSMRVHVWLNGTQTGYSYADGRDLYTRVGIEVYYLADLVFSQDNLTQAGGSQVQDPMWQYDFTILLNGNPLYNPPNFGAGLIYTVLFTYEIYMVEET